MEVLTGLHDKHLGFTKKCKTIFQQTIVKKKKIRMQSVFVLTVGIVWIKTPEILKVLAPQPSPNTSLLGNLLYSSLLYGKQQTTGDQVTNSGKGLVSWPTLGRASVFVVSSKKPSQLDCLLQGSELKRQGRKLPDMWVLELKVRVNLG